MIKKMFLTACYLIWSFSASAQSKSIQHKDSTIQVNLLKEVVITGTRFEVPIEKSGKTIYKISSENIAKNAGKTVADILNGVPGVQMEGNFGSPGTNVSLYVRGGRNKNTLILLDGVPLNDPSGIQASYELNLLPISQIESIEVLKGGLSTLYGTGASSAVINIKLKEIKGNQIGGDLEVNYGSYSTLTTSGSMQGKSDKFSYLIAGNYSNSNGFSAASDELSATPFGKDGFEQRNGLLKLGYDITKKFKIDGVISYDDFETAYDDAAFLDAENFQHGTMFRIGLTPTYKYSNGAIQLKTLYATNSRKFTSSYPMAYNGRNFQLDVSQHQQLTSNIRGIWGITKQDISYEQEGDISFGDSEFSLLDPYASLFYEHQSGFNLHVGARLNSHSEYNTKFVYNVNPSFLMELSQTVRIKLIASASTSFITPTGYQLFSSYGNIDLKPEESLNYELGSSFYINNSLILNIAYFDRTEENAIDFVSQYDASGNWIGGSYLNLSNERHVKGLEADFSYALNEKIAFSANYSHASAEDPTTFYRIPKEKYGFSAAVLPFKYTSVTLKYNYTGKRTVFDYGNNQELDLKSYELVDIYLQHKLLNSKLTAFMAVNNMFDKDFVSVFGFTTKGRNYNMGLKYNFN